MGATLAGGRGSGAPEEQPRPPTIRDRLRALDRRLRSLGSGPQALLAFLVYTAVAVALFAGPVLTRFGSASVGKGGNDAQTFAWSLAWWPHAIREGVDPLFTEALWAPTGVNLAWVTTIPGPSLVMWPVTEAFGPVASLNLLLLAAPPLAGWAAFLVCRRLTGTFWPSLAGGFLFGFSDYLMGHMVGHPNLVLVFPVPLAVYLVIRRTEGSMGPVVFVLSMAATLVALFSIFTELFATFTLFAGLALGGAILLGPADLRRPLLGVAGLVAVAYVLVAAVVSPYVLYALRDLPAGPIRSPSKASIDLLSFVVPRKGTLIGGPALRGITEWFTAAQAGDGGYLGIPLLLILGHFAVTERRRRVTWLLLGFALLTAVAALGPRLHIRGRPTIGLPWLLGERLPLIQNALPDRFTMYTWLTVSVIVALWLAARPRSAIRWAAVVLAAMAIVPDLSARTYHQEAHVPAFFARGLYRRHLHPGEIVLVIPFGRKPARSMDMLWQAETDMYFRLTTGNTGFVPRRHEGPTIRLLRRGQQEFLSPEDFAAFIRSRRVESVLVADGYREGWEAHLRALRIQPVHVGGVSLFRLPAPGVLPTAPGPG